MSRSLSVGRHGAEGRRGWRGHQEPPGNLSRRPVTVKRQCPHAAFTLKTSTAPWSWLPVWKQQSAVQLNTFTCGNIGPDPVRSQTLVSFWVLKSLTHYTTWSLFVSFTTIAISVSEFRTVTTCQESTLAVFTDGQRRKENTLCKVGEGFLFA